MSRILSSLAGKVAALDSNALLALGVTSAVVFLALVYAMSSSSSRKRKEPPVIPHTIPFLGSMISFGMNPIQFLKENNEKYGDVFTFLMFGRKMTYLFGAHGNNFVLNTCKLREVSAEEAYKHLTVPVFGEGVVYDVPNHVLMEQKKFVKHGLSPENLRIYVGIIQEETREYFKRWNGLNGSGELSQAMAELTIMTASRCLMGAEIREQLDEKVADLYCDLDKGFTPLNFLFPYLPLPSYWNRDRAHIQMRDLFLEIMKKRREQKNMDNSDMMQALMDSEYRDGRKMTDREVACLMIALLMAGQHTSSTTGTWCLAFLADNAQVRKALMDEQKSILGPNLEAPLDYDALKQMNLLDACVRETLRLKPPILTLLRKVMEDVEYEGYIIPEGNYICVAPVLSQLDYKVWGPDAGEFNPYRFLDGRAETTEAIGHGASSSYLPFGAGRHRCIGESFAYIQLKTIIATFVQLFEDWKFPAGRGMPETDFTTLIAMPVKPVTIDFARPVATDVSSKGFPVIADGGIAKEE